MRCSWQGRLPRHHLNHVSDPSSNSPVTEHERKAAAYIEIARQRITAGDESGAVEYFSRALSFDPKRLDVHVDLAELEISRGNLDAAVRRLDAVANAYIDSGRPDLAEDVRNIAAVIGAPETAAVEAAEPPSRTEPMSILLTTPRRAPREKTVCIKTVLRFPDGSLMPAQPTPPKPKKTASRRPSVRFRVAPPPAPRRPSR